MEVARNLSPDLKFSKFIDMNALKNKIILIFDECTSGFRQNFGGM